MSHKVLSLLVKPSFQSTAPCNECLSWSLPRQLRSTVDHVGVWQTSSKEAQGPRPNKQESCIFLLIFIGLLLKAGNRLVRKQPKQPICTELSPQRRGGAKPPKQSINYKYHEEQ